MDMIKRYEELYEDMVTSSNVQKMHVFGTAEKWVFGQLVSTYPRLAQTWLEKLEAVCWDNYLSDSEAKDIASHLINQDGAVGPKWGKDMFLQTINKLGGETEKKPQYNDNALWVTANMIYSDHAKSIALDMGSDITSAIPAEKMMLSCYRKAVEKLCDKDRPRFIREYFAKELE